MLTETTAKRTPELQGALHAGGWSHIEATSPPEHEYGTMIASRSATRRVPLDDGPAAHRALLVEMDGRALSVAGCYMPLPENGGPGSTLQTDFLLWLAATLDRHQSKAMVIAGDWNTCIAEDGAGKDLPCADHLVSMKRRGWQSAFRALHPEVRARSWWHPSGSAFRIDDAFLSPGFGGTLRAAEYVTSAGEHALALDRQGARPASTLSDHAAFVMDLDLKA